MWTLCACKVQSSSGGCRQITLRVCILSQVAGEVCDLRRVPAPVYLILMQLVCVGEDPVLDVVDVLPLQMRITSYCRLRMGCAPGHEVLREQ